MTSAAGSLYTGFVERFLSATCVLLGALALRADGDVSPVVFHLEALNQAGAAYVEVGFDDGLWNPDNHTYVYTLPAPVELVSEATGETVAWLLDLDLFARTNTSDELILSLGLYSGITGTQFTIDSPVLEFRSIPANHAVGRCSASITATDLDGNFARVSEVGPIGVGVCHALFNGDYPDTSEFSHLLSLVYAGAFGSSTGTQNDPPWGYRPFDSIVRNTSLHMEFTVTPNDLAYASVRFTVPAPTQYCDGDVDASNFVDVQDLALLLAAFGEHAGSPRFDLNADFDADGQVTLNDLAILLAAFGDTCP